MAGERSFLPANLCGASEGFREGDWRELGELVV